MAQLDHIFLLRTQLVQTFCFSQFFCAIFEQDKQLSVYLICSSSSSALCQNLITLPCPTVRPHNQANCFSFFLSAKHHCVTTVTLNLYNIINSTQGRSRNAPNSCMKHTNETTQCNNYHISKHIHVPRRPRLLWHQLLFLIL